MKEVHPEVQAAIETLLRHGWQLHGRGQRIESVRPAPSDEAPLPERP